MFLKNLQYLRTYYRIIFFSFITVFTITNINIINAFKIFLYLCKVIVIIVFYQNMFFYNNENLQLLVFRK